MDDSDSEPQTSKTPRRSLKKEVESSDYEISHDEDSANDDIEVLADSAENDVEMQEEVADLTEEKTPGKSRKRAAPVNTYSPYHFKHDSTNSYMPFVPQRWTPQNTYRLPSDIILTTIRECGSEGLGRSEIGQAIGYDATTKSGGRKVSNLLANCTSEHPEHVGQFQKMNGKIRTIRFYWKESEQPEKFEVLLREFQELSGIPCPFKIGEVIKFPDKKLNTLRVSDITLKRFNRLLKMINELRVVVTINKVIKYIYELEMADGYKFQIDKKSVMKCLLALQNKGLARVWDAKVRSDNVNHPVQIVTHGEITRVDDEEVQKTIQEVLDSYHREGRVFPHGQLRVAKKRLEESKILTEFDEKMGTIDEDLTRNRTIKDRYHFFRLQTVRNSWKGRNMRDDVEPDEPEEDDPDDTILDDSQLDETVNDGVAENPDGVDGDQEIPEEDPKMAMQKLFAKNPTVPVQNKRSSAYYFGRDTLGYQGKTIRLLILHEMAYHFVYGHPEDTKPSLFDIFPPTKAFDKWPSLNEYAAHVYFDEESPYRYMPPQPKYDGIDRGWFMVQDFLAAMPLSVFVLANYVPTTIDRAFLMSYLTDPVKRHLPIGYLPVETREILMKDKKIHKQLQHALFTLGAMGLVALGPNPSVRRFPGAASEMFYVAKKTHLYDTSTSTKSYTAVIPPVEQGFYVRYEYEFDTRTDVTLYWHHLRAIVQSTPLGFRLDMDQGDSKYESRHRQYSNGCFDRKIIEHDQVSNIQELYPRVLTDGVAGFDSALFLHLKRHWDICTVPHVVVAWFITKFRKCSDEMKREIEKRVRSVHKDWNNFTRLSLTDKDSMKSASNKLKVEYPPKMIKKFGGASKSIISSTPSTSSKKLKPKKRKLDSVDLVSSSARISVRCRFSPKERDQLILIRAVGFFLNPVYRFWLDPTVLRDLMHEFVPESRNKTVQSLMACGVRELVRTNRLAYLQRVVRNLSTFPEMRRLRSELCSSPVVPGQSKTDFFKAAFRTAMRLLFVDNNRIPPTSMSDKNFKLFLEAGNVSVTKEITVSNACPYRSQKPISYGHIQHCVAANILISVLIHSKNGAVPEAMLEQVPPAVLQTVLQSLRSDGLVSRSRTLEAVAELANKKDATLSYYFRHFFAHRCHSDLVEGSGRLLDEVNDPKAPESIELHGDGPEVVIAASTAFYSDKHFLEMDVDGDILDAFCKVENDETIKKIRYLESADLHFEKIRVNLVKNSESIEDDVTTTTEASIDKVLKFLDNSRDATPTMTLDEYIQNNKFELDKRREIRAICHVIKASRPTGITIAELKKKVKIPLERIEQIVAELNEVRQILAVGVDDKRWVSNEYEACWTVQLGENRWCPRPWVSPEGTISLPVVRWITESILLLIIGKVGIQMKDVISNYEFAIQPVAVREIISLLEHLECLNVVKKFFPSTKMSSPFSPPTDLELVVYIYPTVDALEKFSRIFHNIELMPMMISKIN
ncbi:hypothetical protein GCK72_016085 [Caenorhabditis remanei]|uniref:GTF3C1 extended winged-helix domain-containing protein n=1 Tax=Caenorhabditis remanei TaxID=31234 RepID=A0A6A5GVW2_CAERE|nr:hypothetical protein GCK72_016085 [Caenorhabditis remanei]KAF1759618.1 hypothetical protein GCK72_016085 [Caenorhabditis remanei]